MDDKKLFEIKKHQLLESLVKNKYLKDKRLYNAFLEVPLEEFIPSEYKDPLKIYEDMPNLFYFLNRENYRTISAPHMISIMLQGLSLKENDDLLILGAKSGYIAALAHKLAPKGEIIVIEANSDIAKITLENLKKLNLADNITVVVKNPLEGMPGSPWQKILVTGSIKQERIHSLLKQLDKNEGVLYAPIGGNFFQIYTQILRINENYFGKKQLQVRFTPLMTQVELDELELMTDIDELEEVEIIEDPSKVDKTLGKSEEKINIKYASNILDELEIVPKQELLPKQEMVHKQEVDLKQRDTVLSYLNNIEEIIKKLKKEEKIETCFSCLDDIEIQIDKLKKFKKIFGLKIKKIQNFLNQIRSYMIVRKELGLKEEDVLNKKIEIINRQIEEINELHELLSNEINRIKNL